MKNIGVVRSIDKLGRLVIPKEIRDAFGISLGDPVQMSVEGNKVIIEKYKEACLLCGRTSRDMLRYNDKGICYECGKQLTKDLPKD